MNAYVEYVRHALLSGWPQPLLLPWNSRAISQAGTVLLLSGNCLDSLTGVHVGEACIVVTQTMKL